MPASPASEIPDWYEREERDLAAEYIEPGMRVLEVGAGIGAVTREILKAGASVLACEPQPKSYTGLLENAPEALAWCVAVTAERETRHVALNLFKDATSASQWHTSHAGPVLSAVLVPALDIHSLLFVSEADVLVLDCEGKETELLTDAVLRWVRLIICEVHPDFCPRGAVPEMFERLYAAGFKEVERRYGFEDKTYTSVFKKFVEAEEFSRQFNERYRDTLRDLSGR